jgi:hypothetical protein
LRSANGDLLPSAGIIIVSKTVLDKRFAYNNQLNPDDMPSSVVSKFHYHPETQTLRVTYVSGMVYDYLKVPEEKYLAMKAAFSKGTYLNLEIKGSYEFRKVDLL